MSEIYNIQQTVRRKSLPGAIANCPPGLEDLAEVNQLLVRRRFDVDAFCQVGGTQKTYDVLNNQGQRVYFAEERSRRLLRPPCCGGGCWGPLAMRIYDTTGQEVVAVRCRCGFPQKLTVEAPPGEKIGYVCQCFRPLWPKFSIQNERKEAVVKIKGPCFISGCLWNLRFNVLSPDEETVLGTISQHGPGFVTRHHKFGIQLPFDLDAKTKALVLAAGFLVDYMYFEFCP